MMFPKVITERRRAEEEHRRLVARRAWPRRCGRSIAARTSSWPCWPTSCATRWRRSRWPRDDAAARAAATSHRLGARGHRAPDRQLTRLVDDLLDVSRITLGKISPEPVRAGPRSDRRQAVEAVRPLLDCASSSAWRDMPGGAAAGLGRRRAVDAGHLEPAQQRGQVHRRRRPHRVGGAAGRRRAWFCP